MRSEFLDKIQARIHWVERGRGAVRSILLEQETFNDVADKVPEFVGVKADGFWEMKNLN